MLKPTFMVPETLHAIPYIHGIFSIICHFIHSCVRAHYMPFITFMSPNTLHV